MTLLPLDLFRKQISYNPYHFYGLSNADVPVVAECASVLKQYAYQNNQAIGRTEMLEAIAEAESLLQTYLGYAIAPKYSAVTFPWPRYYDNAMSRWGTWDATGRYIAPRLPFGYGYVQALGTELLTLVGTVTVAGASLVFSNVYNVRLPSLYDTFTITLATTETDPNKLAVYFVAADRLDGEPVGDKYRIQPLQISITGGVATIIGRIWLLVRPALYEDLDSQPLDPGVLTALGPYAQSLVVYQRTTDPTGATYDTSMVTLNWETSPVHGWWCGCGCQQSSVYAPNASGDPGATGYGVGRGVIRDAKMGIIGVDGALYNSTSGVWLATPWANCHEPDSLTVRVLSGWPLVNGQVDPIYQRAVTHLAIAQMGRPICACESSNLMIEYYQQDLSRSSGSSELFAFIGREDLSNPLGTRRGATLAWKAIRHAMLTPGVVGY